MKRRFLFTLLFSLLAVLSTAQHQKRSTPVAHLRAHKPAREVTKRVDTIGQIRRIEHESNTFIAQPEPMGIPAQASAVGAIKHEHRHDYDTHVKCRGPFDFVLVSDDINFALHGAEAGLPPNYITFADGIYERAWPEPLHLASNCSSHGYVQQIRLGITYENSHCRERSCDLAGIAIN